MPKNPLTEKFDIKSIFSGNTASNAKLRDNNVIDTEWVKSRFLVPDKDLDADVTKIRYNSIASLKFTDSSIGGNIFVNPRPQFNALTDPKADNAYMNYLTPNLNPNQTSGNALTSTGMGEGYSKLIDDNQQTVFLEFGLPKFNSLIDFFFRAVDYSDSVLANTGRPSYMYNIGHMIGTAVGLIAFPILSVTIHMGNLALLALLGDKSLKFYYFNSKMSMYWGTVNTIVTQLVTEQGLLAPMYMPIDNSAGGREVGIPAKLTQGDIDNLNELIPGIISEKTNYIDVFAIITKAQRAAMKQKEIIYKRMADGSLNKEGALDPANFPGTDIYATINETITFGTYTKAINDAEKHLGDGDKKPDKPSTPTKKTTGNTSANGNVDAPLPKFTPTANVGTYKIPKNSMFDKALEAGKKSVDASLRQGGAYAVFAVDYTGSTSESFSNSVTNINMGDKAKQIAKQSRSVSYDLARGNMLGDNVIHDAITGVRDLLFGVVAGLSFNLTNVMGALTGNAYVEIPKRWDDSSMSFKQNTYNMQLVSPYNTFLSQLQNIYVPLCMILAGVLPLATGKSSYTSPYLCTLFSKGIENIQLGMITSVSVTRGTSNLGFDKKRNPLAIDVSFTVTDFSTLVTSPVSSSIFGELFNVTMEDDTPLGNYISVLGGRDIITSKYRLKPVPIRLSRTLMKLDQTFNANRMGFLIGESLADTLGGLAIARSLPTLYKK